MLRNQERKISNVLFKKIYIQSCKK